MTQTQFPLQNVLDTPEAKKIVVEVINGLLFGAPEITLLNQLHRKYDVEKSTLSKLIDSIDVELNNLGPNASKQYDLISHFKSLLDGANPVGLAYQDLVRRISQASSTIKSLNEEQTTLNSKRDEAVRKLDKIAEKDSRSLSDWVVDHPDELANDSLNEVMK